jgi:hypothetical protein
MKVIDVVRRRVAGKADHSQAPAPGVAQHLHAERAPARDSPTLQSERFQQGIRRFRRACV